MNDMEKIKELILASDELACNFYNNRIFQASIDQSEITLKLLGGKNPSVLKSMACAYYELCNVHKSLELFRDYMDITKSTNSDDIRQFAQYLTRTNLMDEARDLIFNQSECLEKHLDMAWFLHREGRLKEAFAETEFGKSGAFWTGTKYPPNCLRWQGQNISGKKLCLIGEAGLGDEMIFSRWIKDLKELGAIVYYYTDNSLKDVITRNFNVLPYDPNLTYDYWVPSMSLPYLLKKETPGNEIYLTPNPTYVDKWKKILEPYGDIIVLNWTGEQDHMENRFREIPVEYIIPKIKDQGTLVSVCMAAPYCPEGVVDLTKDIHCWEDTLAILSLSKMCYTMSSSVSVAAGALGIKTYLYDLIVGYFTWSNVPDGGLSDWFSNVTVWRQETHGDWLPVIDRSIDRFVP